MVSGPNSRACWQPRRAGLAQLAGENTPNEAACAGKETILILGFLRCGWVRVVHITHHRGDGNPTVLEPLLNVSRRDGGRIEDGNAIVVGVNGLNKIRVKLLVQYGDVLVV